MHFPAEWTQQSAILIAWPHAGTDWAARLHQVESTYIALARAVTRFEHLLICVADKALGAHVSALLDDAKVPMNRVHFAQISYDDTWLRDSGPITLRSPQGFALLDFRFTGWGGKYQSSSDDALVGKLLSLGVFQSESTHQRIDFALEGGGIETDGQGTLLSTWHCLHERHPDLSREEVSALLQRHLHQDRVLWLDHGYLEGDSHPVSRETVDRHLCDTGFIGIKFDRKGQILDLGRTERLFVSAQRLVISVRDGGCLFLHCTKPPSACEVHHITDWRHGGKTDVRDGVLLCQHHHMLLHNNKWKILREHDR